MEAEAAEDGTASVYEEWKLAGDNYYSRRELYTLRWDHPRQGGTTLRPSAGVNLDVQRVFCASFGGPIAMCRDESKVVLQLGGVSRPDIHIYTASGRSLGVIMWSGRRLVAAGWIGDEELLTVDDSGYMKQYTALGQEVATSEPFSLGKTCEEEGIAEAIVFDAGVVARSATGKLWAVADACSPRAVRLPEFVGPGSAVHCMAVIPPSLSLSGALEVVVAVDAGVVVVDTSGAAPSPVVDGPIVRLAISPCGQYVAGFGADSVVHIWSGQLEERKTRLSVPDTPEDMAEALGLDPESVPWGPPDGFAWCGSDGIVASWNGVGALLVTLQGAWLWWDVGYGSAVLVAEIDGVRAVAEASHVLLRRVPTRLASVLEIGSTSPGALLHDARNLYERRDANAAAELLDVLKAGDLPSAAIACVDAAAAALDPGKQESLLKAGCYGSAFLALHEEHLQRSRETSGTSLRGENDINGTAATARKAATSVASVAKKLRVLNALHESSVAIPLTMPQLELLGAMRLANRLAGRRHYLLALRVCDVLDGPREQVLLRWACDKIAVAASSASDRELMDALANKLEGQSGVKWALVAMAARSRGRPRLAALLAKRDACSVDQVPLLLCLGEVTTALRRAVDAGNPDLVFEVVHSGWRAMHSGSSSTSSETTRLFWENIQTSPHAGAVLLQYISASASSQEHFAYWEAIGDQEAIAAHHVATALVASSPDAACREWNKAKDVYAQLEKSGREDKFESGAAAAAKRLLDVQANLEKTAGREGLVGLSVVDTVRTCLRFGLREPAQKVAREFKVPEKQQMLVAVADAASKHDWAALRAMAGRLDRRAPITLEHFVTASQQHGAPIEVITWFVDRITGDDAMLRRAQLYAGLGMEAEARALAEQAELAGAGAGVLASLRDAVGGGLSFIKSAS